jgi:uncharacterized protein YoxC
MTGPSWVGPTVAIATAVIALSALAVAAGLLITLRAAVKTLRQLQQDIGPALGAVRGLVEEGKEVTAAVRQEVLAVVDASRHVRDQVEAGVTRVKERLGDLEALYDVVEEELEETALDVASALRRFRLGAGLATRLRRAVARRNRR